MIGLKCKRGDTFSQRILIGRRLFLLIHVRGLTQSIKLIQFLRVGVNGAEVTPVPIPNTEVKLCREDDTWLATAWESISMPA